MEMNEIADSFARCCPTFETICLEKRGHVTLSTNDDPFYGEK